MEVKTQNINIKLEHCIAFKNTRCQSVDEELSFEKSDLNFYHRFIIFSNSKTELKVVSGHIIELSNADFPSREVILIS